MQDAPFTDQPVHPDSCARYLALSLHLASARYSSLARHPALARHQPSACHHRARFLLPSRLIVLVEVERVEEV